MKKSLLALLLLAGTSQAAITISGAAAISVRDQTGNVAVSAGTALLIVDTGGDGFLGMGTIAPNTTLTEANDPHLNPTLLGTTIGSTFGGDLVLNTMTTSASGTVAALLINTSVADYVGKNFAIVWITNDGGYYGILRGTDWTFPAADSGTYTMSPADANGAASYYQVNSNNPAPGALAFRTGFIGGNGGAVFVVPEPSAVLLGAIGALGIFRRRRSL